MSEQKPVMTGIDLLLEGSYNFLLKGKRIGILTNHTGVNRDLQKTGDLLKEYAKKHNFRVTAFFAPEHGFNGAERAYDHIHDGKDKEEIPIYSLHGKTRRPTEEMLSKIDTLIFDIQDVGSRSYTYNSTLFFAMEEAAKHKKEVIVLDRPNPINGNLVDGPMMHEDWRSMVGYINVPYCHGMTTGELARFFNSEYRIGCKLTVIPMRGWKREMTYSDTGLQWIPTSPQIPEASTTWFYPITGLIGELQLVSIGVGYTLPFKLVGAPWIDSETLAHHLNKQNFPGVSFQSFHYKPYFGRFADEDCKGVLIVITDHKTFKPVRTQYLILGILKSLYPEQFAEAVKKLEEAKHRREMLCKVSGNQEICRILMNEKYLVWKLDDVDRKEREEFLNLRKKYLIADY